MRAKTDRARCSLNFGLFFLLHRIVDIILVIIVVVAVVLLRSARTFPAAAIFLIHPHFVHLMLLGNCCDHYRTMASMRHLIVGLSVRFQWTRALLRKRSGVIVLQRASTEALDHTDVAGARVPLTE